CIGLGKVIATFKNARFTQAWTPLVPLINGKVVHDGGGAATSWLVGTWQGRKVRALMSPDRNRYSGESGFTFHEFGVELLDVPGGQDWRIEDARITADPALRQRLEAAGVLLLLQAFGNPTVSYSRSQKRISFLTDAGSRWTPTPEHFEAELGLLLRLAKVNEEVNPAPPAPAS
ncbi:MAG TPA: hypothetical protein VFR31_20410, partial [Thermoanaerobaculia bacterium]|nr:hypothetical protein [Thermoanaerobaculia bacterium]